MPTVTYVTSDDKKITVENAKGNLMAIALANNVPGIDGNCGGVCACGTCHVQIAPEWIAKTGAASEAEEEILDFEDNTNDRSRLGCQVELTPELDGLVVRVATS